MTSVAVAVVTLGCVAFAFRDRIVEEYWIWRLKRGKEPEQVEAAGNLGELRARRAAALLEAIQSSALDAAEMYICDVRGQIAAVNAGLVKNYSPPILKGPNSSIPGLKLHTAAAEALRKIRGE